MRAADCDLSCLSRAVNWWTACNLHGFRMRLCEEFRGQFFLASVILQFPDRSTSLVYVWKLAYMCKTIHFPIRSARLASTLSMLLVQFHNAPSSQILLHIFLLYLST
jgi:hypothetical protein